MTKAELLTHLRERGDSEEADRLSNTREFAATSDFAIIGEWVEHWSKRVPLTDGDIHFIKQIVEADKHRWTQACERMAAEANARANVA